MKTVMVLGGVKGVSNEILKSNLNKVYNIAFCGRSLDEGNKIIQSIQAEDKLYFHQIDLSIINEIENYFNETIKRFKKCITRCQLQAFLIKNLYLNLS